MARNQKLTKVIAGRTSKALTAEPGGVLLQLDDDSRMKIRTAVTAAISPGGIKNVSQGIFPGSILITLQDADPDFVYLESDTKVFVE